MYFNTSTFSKVLMHWSHHRTFCLHKGCNQNNELCITEQCYLQYPSPISPVARIPCDCTTGPPDRKMIINALNSGAKVYMVDFEDSNAPTWSNLIEGQINLMDAVRKTITFQDPRTGKQYCLNPTTAVLKVSSYSEACMQKLRYHTAVLSWHEMNVLVADVMESALPDFLSRIRSKN